MEKPFALAEAERFFDLLYRHAPPYVELRTLPNSFTRYREWVKSEDAAIQTMRAVNRGASELRTGVMPRVFGLGVKSSISAFTLLYVDIDRSFVDGLGSVDGFTLMPTAVVASGRGIHAYWVFDKAQPPEFAETWSRMQRAIVYRLQADRSAVDANRVLRVPGTYNSKREAYVELWDSREAFYNVADLREVLGVTDISLVPRTETAPLDMQQPAPVVDATVPTRLARLLSVLRIKHRWVRDKIIFRLKDCPACRLRVGSTEDDSCWIDEFGNLYCWRSKCPANFTSGGMLPTEWLPLAVQLGWTQAIGESELMAVYADLGATPTLTPDDETATV